MPEDKGPRLAVRDEIDFDLDLDMSVASPVATIEAAAPVAERLEHATALDARQAFARTAVNVAVPAPNLTRAARDAVDVISDQDAARLSNRWTARPVPDMGVDPYLVEGPDVLRIGFDGERNQLPAMQDVHLPPALRATEGQVVPFEERTPEWLKVYDLPGYQQNAIRSIGRTVMSAFPCFAHHTRLAAVAGEDPLGFVSMMADFSGNGPSRTADLDRVASWVAENGTRIEAAVLDLGPMIAGYRPEIILCASDEQTYLLVRDSFENGAPVEGSYIYSWAGGRNHYLGRPDQVQRLSEVLNGQARIAAPQRRAAQAQPARQPARRLAAPRRPVNLGEVVEPVAKGKVSVAGLPVAGSAGQSDLLVHAKKNGFKPVRSETGTIFRKAEADRTVYLVPEGGAVPARASAFELFIEESGCDSVSQGIVSNIAELDAALQPVISPASNGM